MPEPAISPPDERHCGECCTGHRHGDLCFERDDEDCPVCGLRAENACNAVCGFCGGCVACPARCRVTEADRRAPFCGLEECPGFSDDPILHSRTCGAHIREARENRRAREAGVD